MDRTYDVFEKLPNDGVLSQGLIPAMDNELSKLKESAPLSPNERLAIHTLGKTVIACANVVTSAETGKGSIR